MIDDYYDETGARKQELVARTPDMAAQRQIVRSLLALRTGESVLDVGSGNGILAREMLEEVGGSGRVVGVDPAQAMVAMSRALCPGASFLQGDAGSLPIGDGEHDAVTASQVLCFVPDVDSALGEMFRVLKRGGRLVILDTDWSTLLWNCRNADLLARVVAELTSAYASAHVPRTLSRRLAGAGFDVTARIAHPIVNWTFDTQCYSGQVAAFLPREDAGPVGEQSLGAAWADELEAMSAAGEYMFSINRYVFCARKP